jgi:hypothetical protein
MRNLEFRKEGNENERNDGNLSLTLPAIIVQRL